MTIGLLTIGQSPRVDITGNFAGFDFVEGGALDGLSLDAVHRDFAPGPDDVAAGHTVYVSRMADGTEVKVLKSAVSRGLQQRIDEIAGDCSAIVVLCTGTFEGLRSPVPLIFPDEVLRRAVVDGGLGAHLHVVMPAAEQRPFLEGKWEPVTQRRSFSSASPYQPFPAAEVARSVLRDGTPSGVVLDCMGFRTEHREALAAALAEAGASDLPIILPQRAVPEYVAGLE
jgi:protein AroM